MLGLAILFAVALGLLVLVAAALLAREMRHPQRQTMAWAMARGRPCDPAGLGLGFEEWTLDVDGAHLPVWEIVGKAQRREGAEARGADENNPGLTIILVHGWGQSRIAMLTRLEPWIEHASRLVLYDLRGHGDSTGGASRLGDREGQDLLQLIGRLGDGPIMLVGWSMGGVIALAAAASGEAGASRIAGVITLGAYVDFHSSLQGRLAVQSLPGRPLTDLALQIHRAMGVRPPGGGQFVERLDGPLFVIHGDADDVVPSSHAEQLARQAGNAKLLVIPDGSHVDPRDASFEEFDEVVGEFIQDLAGGAVSSTLVSSEAEDRI